MKNIVIGVVVVVLLASAGTYFYISNKPVDVPEPVVVPAEEVVEEGTSMSFFVTSVNPGKGGDLGGIKGADAYCQKLAETVGSKGKTWRAYLSSGATADTPVVNARERIGTGPWYNAKGDLIAEDIFALHTKNNIDKNTALTEKGDIVPGKGDEVNMHDILTGSDVGGFLLKADGDTTCQNWTSEGSEFAAVVGHHDRMGIDDSAPMKLWNSSHATRGCSLENFKQTGGAGLFYCFAE